jgi:hypothetical protein
MIMKAAFIVVREERHIDPKYWVCIDKDDAINIASAVGEYWSRKYCPDEVDIDRTLYEDLIFNVYVEDAYRIFVKPITIRDTGESGQDI